jgi:BirA family transcriptional regulator, biotin operon repressor / biotin---[acetyl-CoA-carboxylase] ligase
MPDPLPADLAEPLQASSNRRRGFGDQVLYFTETGSTNDVASALADRGAAEGTIVVASSQTAGRGRMGRVWHSPPDAGLYVSIICRTARAAPYLTLAGGVATAEGIATATGLPVEIKWPNDIVVTSGAPVRRRKLAGILAEGVSTADGLLHVILGIGINIRPAAYPPELAERVTSIEAELGRGADRGAVLVELLVALANLVNDLENGNRTALLARWRALAPSAQGAALEYDTPAGRRRGTAAGIADDGALLVRVGDRIDRVVSGEIMWK